MNNYELGPHINNQYNRNNINNNILISLLPIIIYSVFLFKFEPIINIFITISISILLDFILNTILKNRIKLKNYLNIEKYINPLIIVLMLPINIKIYNLLLIISIYKIIEYMLNKFNIKINIIPIIILIYLLILGNYLNIVNYKIDDIIYILINNHTNIIAFNCPFLLIISFIYLSLTKSIKWRIVISSLITFLILNIFTNFNYINLLNGVLLFSLIYIASRLENSPIYSKSQYIFGIIIGIMITLLFNLNIIYSCLISIFSISLINPLIDIIYVKIKYLIKR